MRLPYIQIVSSGLGGKPTYIVTRFDDAVKYHVQLGGKNVGSVLRFTDDRDYLGWYATPDDCTGGPCSGAASRYRWAGGFRSRSEAVAYLRGHANAGSSWWAEAATAA